MAMVSCMQTGHAEECFKIYQRFLPLIVFEQQPGVAIRKEILRRRGLISSNHVRHPGIPIDPATSARLDNLLNLTFPGQDLTKPVTVSV